MHKYHTTAARIMLALVFLGLVMLKLAEITNNPNGYLQYQMTLGQFGLPSVFAPLLILVQLVGGIALLIGYKTKLFARVLMVLALFTAIVLGRVIPDMFFLYLGIAGGMWLLSLYPNTALSLDK